MHEIMPQSYGWLLYVDVPIRELVANLFDPWRLKISKPRMHEIIPQSYGWPLYVDVPIRELVATLLIRGTYEYHHNSTYLTLCYNAISRISARITDCSLF